MNCGLNFMKSVKTMSLFLSDKNIGTLISFRIENNILIVLRLLLVQCPLFIYRDTVVQAVAILPELVGIDAFSSIANLLIFNNNKNIYLT